MRDRSRSGSDYKVFVFAIVLVGLVLICAVLAAALAVAYFGPDIGLFETPSEYFYSVSLHGLDGVQSNGYTEILVPVPYANGAPVFSDEELTGSFDNWESTVVSMSAGKQISLKNREAVLNDVSITYYNRSCCHIYISRSSDVYLNPCNDIPNQDKYSNSQKLADYLTKSYHSPFYGADKSGIASEIDGVLNQGQLHSSYTSLVLKGSIGTSGNRVPAIDMNFHALPGGKHGLRPVPSKEYFACSYRVILVQGNMGLNPVVVCGFGSGFTNNSFL